MENFHLRSVLTFVSARLNGVFSCPNSGHTKGSSWHQSSLIFNLSTCVDPFQSDVSGEVVKILREDGGTYHMYPSLM